MRLFYLDRIRDETGVSGTGIVVEGVEFSDGSVAIRWLTATNSLGIYRNIDDLLTLHGHNGGTVLRWIVEPNKG